MMNRSCLKSFFIVKENKENKILHLDVFIKALMEKYIKMSVNSYQIK